MLGLNSRRLRPALLCWAVAPVLASILESRGPPGMPMASLIPVSPYSDTGVSARCIGADCHEQSLFGNGHLTDHCRDLVTRSHDSSLRLTRPTGYKN